VLFAVHVLAGSHRLDDHRRVPVIGRTPCGSGHFSSARWKDSHCCAHTKTTTQPTLAVAESHSKAVDCAAMIGYDDALERAISRHYVPNRNRIKQDIHECRLSISAASLLP